MACQGVIMTANIWIVQGDGILCTSDGLPFVLKLSNVPTKAIHLGFAETHNKQSLLLCSPNQLPISHAMDINDAIKLGLIFAYGDGYDTKTVRNLKIVSFRELLTVMDNKMLNLMARAIMLIGWHNDHQFCSRCGAKTTHHPQGEHAKICPKCRHHAYPRVQPCIIVAITRIHPKTHKQQILLARHHHHKSGIYGLIAGFVEVGETLSMAVHREVYEEVRLLIDDIRYFDSQPWPHPSNLMVGFIANYKEGQINIQRNELVDAQFFDIDQLPPIPNQGTIACSLIQAVVTA